MLKPSKSPLFVKKLLSLPPNLVGSFHDVTRLSTDEFFCTNDPVGHRLGSGGGTAWLLQQAFLSEQHNVADEATPSQTPLFDEWLGSEKRILIHAGGQSRRLPAYAPSGKILTPVPVFRWERGQRLDQTLLDLQLPLYERLMSMAPDAIHTMVVSGDVLIRTTHPLPPVPDADVVCFGLWLDASVAKNHGVFVSRRKSPSVLKQMLQKPSVDMLNELQGDHLFLTDIGVWLLSDKAVKVLMKKAGKAGVSGNADIPFLEYDLYGEFGCGLGVEPTIPDDDLRQLTVAIVPLTGGEFYHFGTSREMISSTLRLQNLVNDQREIMHHDRKPHPSIFVQNAVTDISFTEANTNIWIENSHIGKGWKISHDHIITGVPQNDWQLQLEPGECIDVVPVGNTQFALRRYHMDDRFAGAEQQKQQFPVVEGIDGLNRLMGHEGNDAVVAYLSAEDLGNQANLQRLVAQRRDFQRTNYSALARNWMHSVFYQLDLSHVADAFQQEQIPLPPPLPATAPLLTRIHDAMFRGESDSAFALLREGLIQPILNDKQHPRLSVYQDQIVWGRSPVRIDIAGGWTDTPPSCLMEGGTVINLAIELNGQPPLQVYIKPCREPRVVLRSIDLGAIEVVETYEQLSLYNKVGSPFSIPKAALVLAGFLPDFSAETYPSLRAQLEDLGCGIELTLLSAIPAGSGLGTSSILAATVLGALSDFCGLGWDKNEIGRRTLILEQLLTTGGGWQDQFGGVLGGVKLLQTTRGFEQSPTVRWLPDDLYTQPEYAACHLLYYTGITRTAKHILSEIVRRMFLNHHDQLLLLRQMKEHTMEMYEAIQRNDFLQMGGLVRKTWLQNQLLDSGTNPAAVAAVTDLVDDLCLGYKLPGAGGGGYLYMVAKDPEAAVRIRQILSKAPCSANARFVDMSLSKKGLQISRS